MEEKIERLAEFNTLERFRHISFEDYWNDFKFQALILTGEEPDQSWYEYKKSEYNSFKQELEFLDSLS